MGRKQRRFKKQKHDKALKSGLKIRKEITVRTMLDSFEGVII